MKNIALAVLLAAAAALPQYGNIDFPANPVLENSVPAYEASDTSWDVLNSDSGASYTNASNSMTTDLAETTSADRHHKHHKHKHHHHSTETTVESQTSDAAANIYPTISASIITSTNDIGASETSKKGSCHMPTKTNTFSTATAIASDSDLVSSSDSAAASTTDVAVASSTDTATDSATDALFNVSSTTSTDSSPTPIPTIAPSIDNTTSSSDAASDNSAFIRGINVGNWLILEKWMDDGSIFVDQFSGASDQWSFDSIDGSGDALQKHWSSWFTEKDVAKIASYGFNALRIPIGYWAFDNSDTPFKQGAAYWMDQAIGWAAKHNMKVLVDLHGSPGSQNGQDHSGHAGAVEWQQGDNLDKSTKVLVQMAQKYGAANYSSVVWGIEMVNEPTANQPNDFGKSQSWAQDAYSQMYDALDNKALRIVTHDSFLGPTKFIGIAEDLAQRLPVDAKLLGGDLPSGKLAGTTFGVDQHDYQLYTDSDNSLDQAAHIQKACGWADALSQAKGSMPTIVGEWSSLTNICAMSDGSTVSSNQGCNGADGCSCTKDDPSKWSQALVEQVRRYVEAQLDVYEQNTNGYFLWSWKGPGGWGVEAPVKAGAFPNHVVNDRKYKGQCGGK